MAFRNKELVHLYTCLVLGKHSSWRRGFVLYLMEGEEQAVQPIVGFNVSLMGRMEEYSSNTDWKQYVERLEIFFEVNNRAINTSENRLRLK